MAGIILAGVDNSETALAAAEKAASLAVAFNAELHVATAFTVNMTETLQTVRSQNQSAAMSSTYRAYHRLVAEYAEEAGRTASGIAEELRRIYPELKIVAKAVEGNPGIALSNDAEKLEADIIVVGNKRVQGPTRILGSVARTVASEANCDLYVVNTHRR